MAPKAKQRAGSKDKSRKRFGPRPRALSAAEDELFRALVKGGAHPKEIYRQLGIAIRRADDMARERGLTLMRYSDGLRARFTTLWMAGAPVQQIAAEMSISPGSVLKRRYTLGLPPRRQDYSGDNIPWFPEEEATLKRLYTKGATAKDIALALGRTEHAVVNQIRRHKLQRGGMRGRTPSSLLADRLRECLEKHGPSPTWRLRDYVQAQNQRTLSTALQRLVRAGLIERVGPNWRGGMWRLAQPPHKAGAELAPRPSQENDV